MEHKSTYIQPRQVKYDKELPSINQTPELLLWLQREWAAASASSLPFNCGQDNFVESQGSVQQF